jgi:hypothetical protein
MFVNLLALFHKNQFSGSGVLTRGQTYDEMNRRIFSNFHRERVKERNLKNRGK